MVENLSEMRVGVLGCGNMGGAVVKAAVSAGSIDPSRLTVLDRYPDKAQDLADAVECRVAKDAETLVESADVVLLAVKPQDALKLLRSVRWRATHTLISVVAGLRSSDLASACSTETPAIVRAMPNTPALIGKGVTGLLAETAPSMVIAEALFSGCGDVVKLTKESLFDAVTALSGSGPAYIFIAIEALADGGVRMGLPRDVAMKLAVSTVIGAGALVKATGKHPAVLKDQVASPGGTTIAGLAALEGLGFRGALIDAVTAATYRGQEIASEAQHDS